MRTPQFAVVGGGIAGLSAAYHLRKMAEESGRTIDVQLYEAADHVGGKVGTVHENGFVMEQGPDSFITQKPDALALCKELGLESELIPCNSAMQHVFIERDGTLHRLPAGFRLLAPTNVKAFLGSRLFSWPAKFRALREPWIPARLEGGEESIAAFVERRFGREILEYAAGPLLSGIYTGEADQLGIESTFPMLVEMERRHGSLTRAFRKQMRAAVGRPSIPMFMSLRSGMGRLTDTLADRVRDVLHLGQRVEELAQTETGWRLRVGGDWRNADAVILALPPQRSAALLKAPLPETADLLQSIPVRSSLAISLGFDRAQRKTPPALHGFGFVTGERENRSLTACTWSSVKFDNRAPDGHELVRVFLAGDTVEIPMEQSDEDWIRAAREALLPLMEWEGDVQAACVSRWPQANPQYTVGHRARMEKLRSITETLPSLAVIGGGLHGVGLPDCIRQGREAAARIMPTPRKPDLSLI